MTKECPECGYVNNDDARFCMKCGGKLDEVEEEPVKSVPDEKFNNTKNDGKGVILALKAWWNKRSTKGKGVTICCLGILIIGLLGAMASPDHTNSTVAPQTDNSTPTPTPAPAPETTPEPRKVTISQLYSNSVDEGTYVKVSGIVQDTDGSMLRLRNSDYKDIYVFGSDLNVYEGQKVTVVGYYDGPFSFTTVMGGSRTTPSIDGANII